VKLELFSSLVEGLYGAALNPADWPRLAQMFAGEFGTESCAIFQFNQAQRSADMLGFTANFDTKAVGDYEAYYNQKDLFAIGISKLGIDRATLGAEIVREAEFFNSEIFDGYAKRIGIFWFVGGLMTLENHFMGAIGLHRPHGARAFDPDDQRKLAMLLPHLSRALLLRNRLAGLTRDNKIVLAALENLSVGMMAVDAQSTLLFANPMAERLLRGGLGLTCCRGCLGATDPVKNGELRRLIQSAALAALGRPTAPGGVLALPRPKGRPLSVLVCPMPPDGLPLGPSTPAALLIFADPDSSPSTSTQALMELYALTPAEARLLVALIDGERLDHYADRHRISINTVRTQSKQIFAKTGHGRQADLIREILANPALRQKSRTPNGS
jgi:DNA-binding CsgD family transcriptional regulator